MKSKKILHYSAASIILLFSFISGYKLEETHGFVWAMLFAASIPSVVAFFSFLYVKRRSKIRREQIENLLDNGSLNRVRSLCKSPISKIREMFNK